MSLLIIASLFMANGQTAAAPEAAAEAKPDKKICRVDPDYTGTRLRKRLCMTQVEWDKRGAGRNAGDLKTLGGR